MTGEHFIENLLERYKSDFDITRDYEIDGYVYKALAEFRVTSTRYVLIEQVKMWSADSFEYILFDLPEKPDINHIEMLKKNLTEYVEPVLVRAGEKYPPEGHMYSYMTVIMVSDTAMEENVVKAFKKISYFKNYLFSIRGYSTIRAIAIDLPSHIVYTNKAAKKLRREFQKLL